MSYPQEFLSFENFFKAHRRLLTSGDDVYKRYYRHLHTAYSVSIRGLVRTLRHEIATHTYAPSPATRFYRPKATGILRPFALLTYRDLLTYQAIANYVAERFRRPLRRQLDRRTFSSGLADGDGDFTFRQWRVGYGRYSSAKARSFLNGNTQVGTFDLVAFYELIDHRQLRSILERYVKNKDLLNLLETCLLTWAANPHSGNLGHGIPQGPEPSALLAECLLNRFDQVLVGNVDYFRYADDIALLGKERAEVERCLRLLDLEAKKYGLVPQSEKIRVRQPKSVREILKGPSLATSDAAVVHQRPQSREAQKILRDMLKAAIGADDIDRPVVADQTKFRFAINRLRPNRYVLRRLAPLLVTSEQFADDLAAYFSNYPNDREAADLLAPALQYDPLSDSARTAYVDAYDVCEQSPSTALVSEQWRRSLEKSLPLDVSVRLFRARRARPFEAKRIAVGSQDPLGRSILWDRLASPNIDPPISQNRAASLRASLERDTRAASEDLATTAAAILAGRWPPNAPQPWSPAPTMHDAARSYGFALGLRTSQPKLAPPFEKFFERRFQTPRLSWYRAFGSDRTQIQEATINLHRLIDGDPSNAVMAFDGLNQSLIFRFSKTHPTLAQAFQRAAGTRGEPDLGTWLRNNALRRVLPRVAAWMLGIHELRLQCYLAHPVHRRTGNVTRHIRDRELRPFRNRASAMWTELFHEWLKFV